MKKSLLTKLKFTQILVTSLFFTCSNFLLAQQSDTDLRSILNAATVVVEGQVLPTKNYEKDPETGNIYTLNTVRITQNFKGNLSEFVTIRTLGGKIGDRTDYVSHSIQLGEGEEGIFILDKMPSRNDAFVFAEQADKIVRTRTEQDREGFDYMALKPIESWQRCKREIAQICKQSDNGIIGKSSRSDTELCVMLTNPNISFESQTIAFDVYVKSNEPDLRLSDISINIKYPVEVFGKNIVQNSKITIEKKVVVENDIYEYDVKDLNEDYLNMHIGSLCANAHKAYPLSNEYEKLARLTFQVEDLKKLSTLSIDAVEVEATSQYYQTDDNCVDFANICLENKLGFAKCTIKSVEKAPFGAGALQTITFKGTGFGGNLGQNPTGSIKIPNANDGGATTIDLAGTNKNYVVDWNNDQIILRISSMANDNVGQVMGSGTWRIYSDLITGDYCSTTVDIDFALSNIKSSKVEKMITLAQNIYLNTTNPDAAIDWYIDGNMNNTPNLQGVMLATFELIAKQAFCDWELKTGIEFRYKGTIIGQNDMDDGKNVISFGNPMLLNALAVTRNRTIEQPSCVNDPYFRAWRTDFDIIFNGQTNWYCSAGTGIGANQIDIYSVLLHEIGHAILLKHSMDTDPSNLTKDDRIMYWSLSNNQIKRLIDTKTSSGISLLKDRTVESINGDDSNSCYYSQYYDLNTSPVGCNGATFTENIDIEKCSIVFNTFISKGSDVRLTYENANVKNIYLFNSIGQLTYSVPANGFYIPTNNLLQGIYLLQYSCNGINRNQKIIIY